MAESMEVVLDNFIDLEPMDHSLPCIHMLVDDVIYEIFSQLSLVDLINCGKACRRFQNISNIFIGKLLIENGHEYIDSWLLKNGFSSPFLQGVYILRNCGYLLNKIKLIVDEHTITLAKAIGDHCTNLEYLTIYLHSSDILKGHMMERLFEKCSGIKTLSIHGFSEPLGWDKLPGGQDLEEEDLDYIFQKVTNLEVLRINCQHHLGCKAFENVPKTLKEFSSMQCCLAEGNWWESLIKKCRQLKVFQINDNITGVDLNEIANFCPDLKELSFELDYDTKEFDFSVFPKLEELNFSAVKINLNNFAKCPLLYHLEFKINKYSPGEGLIGNFSSISHLRYLKMAPYPLASIETLESITLCKDLEYLCVNIKEDTINPLLRCIEQLPKLSIIELPRIYLTEHLLKLLSDAGKRRKTRIQLRVPHPNDGDAVDYLSVLKEANIDLDMIVFPDYGSGYNSEDDDEYDYINDFLHYGSDYDSDIDDGMLNYFDVHWHLEDYEAENDFDDIYW